MFNPAAPFYLEEVTDAGLRALAQHCSQLRWAGGGARGRCWHVVGGGEREGGACVWSPQTRLTAPRCSCAMQPMVARRHGAVLLAG